MKQGKSIEASLDHIVYYPSKASKKYPTIVAIHGRGTDEYDLPPLAFSLGISEVLVISPRAPLPFDMSGGFAWYNLSQEGIPDPQTFHTSLQLLHRFISEIKAGYPVDPEQIILLGFSQGAVMAYAEALTNPKLIRGIAALSGYIPQRSGLQFDLQRARMLSAFASHGTYDQLIPVQLGRESAEFLRKAGANVEYREYSMGHEVREDTVRDLAAWIRNLLER